MKGVFRNLFFWLATGGVLGLIVFTAAQTSSPAHLAGREAGAALPGTGASPTPSVTPAEASPATPTSTPVPSPTDVTTPAVNTPTPTPAPATPTPTNQPTNPPTPAATDIPTPTPPMIIPKQPPTVYSGSIAAGPSCSGGTASSWQCAYPLTTSSSGSEAFTLTWTADATLCFHIANSSGAGLASHCGGLPGFTVTAANFPAGSYVLIVSDQSAQATTFTLQFAPF